MELGDVLREAQAATGAGFRIALPRPVAEYLYLVKRVQRLYALHDQITDKMLDLQDRTLELVAGMMATVQLAQDMSNVSMSEMMAMTLAAMTGKAALLAMSQALPVPGRGDMFHHALGWFARMYILVFPPNIVGEVRPRLFAASRYPFDLENLKLYVEQGDGVTARFNGLYHPLAKLAFAVVGPARYNQVITIPKLRRDGMGAEILDPLERDIARDFAAFAECCDAGPEQWHCLGEFVRTMTPRHLHAFSRATQSEDDAIKAAMTKLLWNGGLASWLEQTSYYTDATEGVE